MDETARSAHRPMLFPALIGRERELEWLERQTADHGRKPIIIYGPGGIGKSSLLNEFVASSPDRQIRRIWSLPIDPREAETMLAVNIALLRDEKRPARVILIDNADDLTPAAIMETTAQITNWKAIRAVVFARRTAIEQELTRDQLMLKPLSASDAEDHIRDSLGADLAHDLASPLLTASDGNPLALSLLLRLVRDKSVEQAQRLLRGDLYGDGGLIVPSRELLAAAKPRIITANEILIERLRREPEGLFELDPRKFEELIADLMEGMGYDVELTPASKDGGKDILARLETPHGKALCLVEAKRYSPARPVQVGLVRQLYGTLHDHGATSAMLVTTSRFTRGANEFQERHQYQLALRDYGHVVDWIGGHGSNRRTA